MEPVTSRADDNPEPPRRPLRWGRIIALTVFIVLTTAVVVIGRTEMRVCDGSYPEDCSTYTIWRGWVAGHPVPNRE